MTKAARDFLIGMNNERKKCHQKIDKRRETGGGTWRKTEDACGFVECVSI